MIVLLSGWAKSGKDTMAKLMIEERGFKRIAFADVLKDMVAEQYNIDRSWLDIQDFKEKPLLNMPVVSKDEFSKIIHKYLVREFRSSTGLRPTTSTVNPDGTHNGHINELISIGQLFWTPRALAILEGSVKRSANMNYWVERALRPVLEDPNGSFVVSDFRYRSELLGTESFLKNNNITTDVVTVRVNRFSDTASTDSSERDLDNHDFTFVIENKKGLDEYLFEVKKTLQRIELNSNPSLWC